MSKKRKSKRYILVTEIISIILFFLGFAFLVICGELEDNGYGDYWWPAVGLISFFSCNLLALFLIFRVMDDATSYEIDEKFIKYANKGLFKLNNMNPESVREIFYTHKFKDTGNGHLRKKMFSFSKDKICYYVKSVTTDNFKKTAKSELKLIDTVNEKSSNVCFILFIYKNGINESDIIELRKFQKIFYISEISYTSIIVLIDSKTNEGRFMDMNSNINTSIYAHGCRLLKKYFPESVCL